MAQRILALTTHPIESPTPRYRVMQYIPKLEAAGFEVDLHTFFGPGEMRSLYAAGEYWRKATSLISGTIRRAASLVRARQYDVILLQTWLYPITFPPFDFALKSLGVPIIYDLDDAYYAPMGSIGDRFRDREWTVRLMRMAHTVVVASDYLSDFAKLHNARVETIATAVDTTRFKPRELPREANPKPVIGWVGSHSTARYLEPLYPVFQALAKEHDFVLRIVGGTSSVDIPGVTVDSVPWKLENEVENFRNLDIGLYPLADNTLARGKHGFKLNQYMSVGIPSVVSDIGAVNATEGKSIFVAKNLDDWKRHLTLLLTNEPLRVAMGAAARAEMDANVSLRVCSERMIRILRDASGQTTDSSSFAPALN